MSVDIKIAPETVTAYLVGELDHHNISKIRKEIDYTIERSNPLEVVLDFTGVTFMDSSGIGLIMGRYKLAGELGAKVVVTGVTPSTAKVMKIAGLEQLVKIKVSQ